MQPQPLPPPHDDSIVLDVQKIQLQIFLEEIGVPSTKILAKIDSWATSFGKNLCVELTKHNLPSPWPVLCSALGTVRDKPLTLPDIELTITLLSVFIEKADAQTLCLAASQTSLWDRLAATLSHLINLSKQPDFRQVNRITGGRTMDETLVLAQALKKTFLETIITIFEKFDLALADDTDACISTTSSAAAAAPAAAPLPADALSVSADDAAPNISRTVIQLWETILALLFSAKQTLESTEGALDEAILEIVEKNHFPPPEMYDAIKRMRDGELKNALLEKLNAISILHPANAQSLLIAKLSASDETHAVLTLLAGLIKNETYPLLLDHILLCATTLLTTHQLKLLNCAIFPNGKPDETCAALMTASNFLDVRTRADDSKKRKQVIDGAGMASAGPQV